MTRPFWFALGFLCVGIGAAGLVLPLVPGVPFLLLAAYAFSRSSPRFHNWLLNHPRFGPPIIDWQRHGSISRNIKIVAVSTMGAALAISIALGIPSWVLALQAVLIAGAATFIVTRPGRPRGPDGVA